MSDPCACRGRLKIAVRDVHTFKLVLIDDFATKSELIDANMASAHIPFFLDWRPFAVYRYHFANSVSQTLYPIWSSSPCNCKGDPCLQLCSTAS